MLVAGAREGITAIRDLRMSGSSKLVFPHGRRRVMDAVYLNTAGGITGGDQFDLRCTLEPTASLRMTTQAAERIYQATGDTSGQVRTEFSVGEDAHLYWLPQETILFDGASLDRHLTFDLAANARLLACETLIFGRAAMGETVSNLRLNDRVDLRRDGALLFADRLRLDGDAHTALSRAAVAGGATAMASVLWVSDNAAAVKEEIRELLPRTAGVSALRDDVLFLRVLAPDSFLLRKAIVPVLERLAATDLPRPWML